VLKQKSSATSDRRGIVEHYTQLGYMIGYVKSLPGSREAKI